MIPRSGKQAGSGRGRPSHSVRSITGRWAEPLTSKKLAKGSLGTLSKLEYLFLMPYGCSFRKSSSSPCSFKAFLSDLPLCRGTLRRRGRIHDAGGHLPRAAWPPRRCPEALGSVSYSPTFFFYIITQSKNCILHQFTNQRLPLLNTTHSDIPCSFLFFNAARDSVNVFHNLLVNTVTPRCERPNIIQSPNSYYLPTMCQTLYGAQGYSLCPPPGHAV